MIAIKPCRRRQEDDLIAINLLVIAINIRQIAENGYNFPGFHSKLTQNTLKHSQNSPKLPKTQTPLTILSSFGYNHQSTIPILSRIPPLLKLQGRGREVRRKDEARV